MPLDPDRFVREARELAEAARAASRLWTPAELPDDPDHPEDGTYNNPPDDDRRVLVFLNGHCASIDMEGRKGGGWGIRLGFYFHEKGRWRVGGTYEGFVTHWMDLPEAP